MSVQVACPVCKTRYTVADNLLGQTIPCKKCQESFVAAALPAADDAPTVAAFVPRAPPAQPAGNPILLFLIGAGAAAVLLGAAGTVAYFLWPEDPPAVVQNDTPQPSPRTNRPRTPITSNPNPKSEPPLPPAPKDEPKVEPKAAVPATTVPKVEPKAEKAAPAVVKAPDVPKAPPPVVKAPDVPKAPPPDVKPTPPAVANVSPVSLVPDTPLVAAIAPPSLSSDRESLFLSAPAGDLCAAAAGRYLVLTLPRSKQLAVLDVTEAKVVKTLQLSEADTKVTAGASVIIAYNPTAHTLERWTLSDFRKAAPVPCPFGQPVYGLALGSASDGPMLIAAGTDRKRFGGALRFLDPLTFKEVALRPADAAAEFGFRVTKGSQVRASADGRVFTTWVPGDRERGPHMLTVTAPRFSVAVEAEPAGHVAPAADGKLLFTGRGVATPEGRPTTGTPDGLAMPAVPAVHGPAYLCVEPTGTTATVSLMVPGRSAPLRVWKNLDLPAPAGPASADPIPPDRRFVFVPAAKLLVALPPGNDRLVFHKLDLPANPPKPGALAITSAPPPVVSRGATFTYTIAAHPPGQALTFAVEEGPSGLTVSPAGVVTWPIPAGQPLAVVTVRVRVRSAAGAEAVHEFRLAVQEAGRTTPK